MSKHIRNFGSFQMKRKNDKLSINETVIQRDSSFIVGGVKVDRKTINSYVKKVKDKTGKDIKSMYSEMEIAEELVRWSINSLDDIDNVPVSALMGGDSEISQGLDDGIETDIVDETGDLDTDLDTDSDDEVDLSADNDDLDLGGDEDLDLSSESDDEFESPDADLDDESDSDLDLGGDDLSEDDEDLPI